MKKQSKFLSLLLIFSIIIQLFSGLVVYAAQIEIAPVVNKVLSNGAYSLTITNNNTNPEVMTTVYSTDGGTTWLENFNYSTMIDGDYSFKFKFIVGDISSPTDESEETSYTIKNQNTEVANIRTETDTLVATTITMSNIFDIESESDQLQTRINNIVDSEQKSFLQSRLDTLKANINSFKVSNSLNIVTHYIDELPENSNISKSELDSVYDQILSLDSSTYRSTAMNSLHQKLKKNRNYTNNMLYLESDLNYSYNKMYLNGGTSLDIKEYIIAPTKDTYVLYVILDGVESISSTFKTIPFGEIQKWIQTNPIEYSKGVISTSGKSLEVKLLGSDYKQALNITYPSNILSSFNYETLDSIRDSISDSFDYMVFDFGFFTDNNTIFVLLYGDFDRDDYTWATKNTANFNDWLTYEVASEIVSTFNKDVEMRIFDRNYDLAMSKSVPNDINFTDGSYGILESYLNNNYETYPESNLKFDYDLVGNQRVTTLKMTGTNFRERYDEWFNIDQPAFYDWVKNTIGKQIIAEKGTNLTIKIYDKNNELLNSISMLYKDYMMDIDEIEDYLNDKYYKRDGLYYDFDFKRFENYNYLTIEVDVKRTDNEWKDLNKGEFEKWIKLDIVNYIMDKMPRNVQVLVKDSRGYSLGNYSYNKEDFGETLAFEVNLNQEKKTFKNLNFVFEITNRSHEVSLYMKGTNFSKNDNKWKDANTSEFKNWEEGIVDELISKFDKNVRVTIKDEKGSTIKTNHYYKDYRTRRIASDIRTLENYLNNYMSNYRTNGTSSTYNNTIRFNYSITNHNTYFKVVAKTYSLNSRDRLWEERNKAKFDGFINAVALKVVDEFDSKVTMEVVDSNNNKLITKTFNKGDSFYKTANTYGRYNPTSTFGLNLSLISEKTSTKNYVTLNDNYLYLLKNDADFKLTNKTFVYNLESNLTNELDLTKENVKTLGELSNKMALIGENIDVEVSINALKDIKEDLNLQISKTDTYNKPLSLAVAGDAYDVTISKAVEDISGGIKLNMYIDHIYLSNPDIGLYKYNPQTKTWVKTSATKGYGKFTLDGATSGKYAIMFTSKSFTDISNSIYRDEIIALANANIISGIGNNKFAPEADVTRAELVKMIIGGLNLTHAMPTTPSFNDVPVGAWYYQSIEIAKAKGIVAGVSATEFEPNRNITRQEVVAVLKRANDVIKSPDQENLLIIPQTYSDQSQISAWAEESVMYMKALGVLANTTASFKANENPKREEVAHLIYNLMKANNIIK